MATGVKLIQVERIRNTFLNDIIPILKQFKCSSGLSAYWDVKQYTQGIVGLRL